ncbi:MAG: chemotaxis protein CheW [Proteobacteria bacterium]|nr:chemotaxis protein CheW [Pseudomonadota bacterium]
MAQEQQFCTFFLDGLFFGVEVERVQEVIRFHDITTVPLAPPVIRGLINLRGEVIAAIDLCDRLELKGHASMPVNVVVRTGDGPVSLLVDDVGDVLDVKQEDFEAPPETLRGQARHLIRGAYKLKERLLMVLDIGRTVDVNASVA